MCALKKGRIIEWGKTNVERGNIDYGKTQANDGLTGLSKQWHRERLGNYVCIVKISECLQSSNSNKNIVRKIWILLI